jgi:hypothetical protein
MEKIKWEDIKDRCPWRMVGIDNPEERIRCAAIVHTHICCGESMCSPWYFACKLSEYTKNQILFPLD